MIGTAFGGPPMRVDSAQALAYAQATGDLAGADGANGDRADRDGMGDHPVPPLFAVVPAWAAFSAAVTGLVPTPHLNNLLHAGHHLHWISPLAVGDELTTEATLTGVRASGAGSWLFVGLRTWDIHGDDRVLQKATLFVRGFSAQAVAPEASAPDARQGGFPPPETPPAPARRPPADRPPLAEVRRQTDPDQAVRYARASGDLNPIHTDPAAAQAAGLAGCILQGLCTMAICAQVVVDVAAAGDAARLRELSVRFSQPVFPGSDLTVSVQSPALPPPSDANSSVEFVATSDSRRVVKEGLARLAPS
ncbi:MAG: MaoC/PaaZ C-terminal domain-containing protein [Acidimicrobiales bacterium]